MEPKKFRKQISTATGLMRRDAGTFMERRGFLRLAGVAATYAAVRVGEYAATETFTRAVVDPALALAAAAHFARESQRPLESMQRDSAIRIAGEAWREDPAINYVIEALEKSGHGDRYTLAGMKEGSLSIMRQGTGSRRLWGYEVEDRPMRDRPDNPALADFLNERYERMQGQRSATVENVVLFPGRDDLPSRFRYVGFVASDGQRVIGVTEPSEFERSAPGGNGPARPSPSDRRMIHRTPANQPVSRVA